MLSLQQRDLFNWNLKPHLKKKTHIFFYRSGVKWKSGVMKTNKDIAMIVYVTDELTN